MKQVPHQPLPDQELIRRFTAGDETAFNTLLDRYKAKIFTTIYLIVKERSVAEDLFQEVMIKVVRMIRAGKYQEEDLNKVEAVAKDLAKQYK